MSDPNLLALRFLTRTLWPVILVATLIGCGQRGPLYLPPDQKQNAENDLRDGKETRRKSADPKTANPQ